MGAGYGRSTVGRTYLNPAYSISVVAWRTAPTPGGAHMPCCDAKRFVPDLEYGTQSIVYHELILFLKKCFFFYSASEVVWLR